MKVIDDLNLVHDLQKDGPGWVDDIALVSLITDWACMLYCIYMYTCTSLVAISDIGPSWSCDKAHIPFPCTSQCEWLSLGV